MLESIKYAWTKNTHLGKYDFRFNALYDSGVEQLTEYMSVAPHVNDVEISERVKSKDVVEKFKEQMKANKPKKKKKGRKGKSKKKKRK